MKKFVASCIFLLLGVLIWRNFGEPMAPADLATSDDVSESTPDRQPAATATSATMVSEEAPAADDLVETIRETQKCFETRECKYPNGDPHEYDFAVSEELRSLLRRLNEEYGNDEPSRQQIEPLARELVGSLNDSVQDAALDLFRHFPTSPDNLHALEAGLKDSPDALLAAKALDEFKRYLGTPLEGDMQTFLRDWVTTGPHFASREVAAGILPFINEKSYPAYLETLARMPAQTAHAQALAAALDEYRRLKSGG